MFCKNCGAPNPDDTRFCTSCGAPVGDAQRADEQPVVPQQVASQPYPQQPVAPQPYVRQPEAPLYQDPYKGFPMKWHKFLVYFALWAGAVVNLILAIQAIKGDHYGGSASAVYSTFPSMKYVDVVYSVMILAIMLLQVVTAIRLMGLKRGAPKLLITLYVVNLISGIVYVGAAYAVVSKYMSIGDLLTPSIIAGFAVSSIMIFANATYYKKREVLFVN